MTDTADPSTWRSVGSYEVLAADFESAGEPWDEVFPSEFTEPVPGWLRAELPDTGWREVTVRDGLASPPHRQLFASPKDGGWVTALVWTPPEGRPAFMGDLSTYQLRPTQQVRRQGLALSWPEPLRVAASELNAVTVTLTNTSDSFWTPDPEDHAFVHGHFLDDAGQSPANCSFAYGWSRGDWKGVPLAPGELRHRSHPGVTEPAQPQGHAGGRRRHRRRPPNDLQRRPESRASLKWVQKDPGAIPFKQLRGIVSNACSSLSVPPASLPRH